MRRPSLLSFLLIGVLASLAAQDGPVEEGVDDLFLSGEDAIVEESTQDHRAAFETDARPTLGGSFTATGGAGIGYLRWAAPFGPLSGFDGSIGMTSEAVAHLDARPGPDFRFYASAKSSVEPLSGGLSWNLPASFEEIFAEYSGIPGLFAKIGKFSMAWGQGKIFNPGNLVSDLSSGYAFRATIPNSFVSLNAIAFLKQEFYPQNGVLSWRDAAAIGRGDVSLPGAKLSLGLRWQKTEGLRLAAETRAILLGIDVYADAAVVLHDESSNFEGMLGVYKDWTNVIAYSEHHLGADDSGVSSLRSGIAVGFNNLILGSVDLGLEGRYDWFDGSAKLLVALKHTPYPGLTAQIFCQASVGAEGAYYVAQNDDPSKRMLLAGMALKLTTQF